MIYYSEPYSHIRDKVQINLDLTNYATEKELDHAKGVGTSDLASKKDFITLQAEVQKLDTNEPFNISSSLNNVKTKVDDLDVAKLKTAYQYIQHR